MAQNNRIIPIDDQRFFSLTRRKLIEKRVQRIRDILRPKFGIAENPIIFRRSEGYKTEFILRDERPTSYLDIS